MNRLINSRWPIIVPVVFAMMLSLDSQADSQQRQIDRNLDEQDINQRSFNLRMLQIMSKQRKTRKSNPQLALAQLQDDFTHLQMVNKQLGLAALGKDELNLKFVTKSASEIQKRAERLKTNLALPLPDGEAEPLKQYTVTNAVQLKTPIVHLARLIVDFTDNPFFKEAAVVETTHAHSAQRDLEKIIRLSDEIKHLSKSLGDSGSLPQSQRKEREPEQVAVEALRRREVPEATLPCSPDEAKWWEKVRAEAIRVRRSGDSGGDKFVRLLKEGRDNSYRVPIPYSDITILQRAQPAYSDEARRLRISGGMALVTEFQADGTVGEVKIVEGLPGGLNESAERATRRTIFLPAVRDGQFVSTRTPMTMSFDVR